MNHITRQLLMAFGTGPQFPGVRYFWSRRIPNGQMIFGMWGPDGPVGFNLARLRGLNLPALALGRLRKDKAPSGVAPQTMARIGEAFGLPANTHGGRRWDGVRKHRAHAESEKKLAARGMAR